MLAVPQTRAAVVAFFTRIGAIDIFLDEDAPTPQPVSPTLPPSPVAESAGPIDASLAHSLVLFELGKVVTLTEAEDLISFPLLVPAEWGLPDEVYSHTNLDLPAATLVWHRPGGSTLSLTEIGIAAFAVKMIDQPVTETAVGDNRAVWLEGPHTLQLLGNWEPSTLAIRSNVLIWADGDVTYRLEGDLELEDARRMAESLKPIDE
jgi:hypothetical protein